MDGGDGCAMVWMRLMHTELYSWKHGKSGARNEMHILLQLKKKKKRRSSRGGKPYLQDIGNHPNGPAVDSFAVGFLGEDLGSCEMTKERHKPDNLSDYDIRQFLGGFLSLFSFGLLLGLNFLWF